MRILIIWLYLATLVSCGIFQELEQYSASADAGWPYTLGVIENFDKFLISSEGGYSKDVELASIQYCFRQSDFHQRKRMPFQDYQFEEGEILSGLMSGLLSLDSIHLNTSDVAIFEQHLCPDKVNVVQWRLADRIEKSTEFVKKDPLILKDAHLMHVFFWHTFAWGEQTRSDTFVAGNSVPTGNNYHATNMLLVVLVTFSGELIYRNAFYGYRQELKPEDEAPNFEVPAEFFNQLAHRTMKAYFEKPE